MQILIVFAFTTKMIRTFKNKGKELQPSWYQNLDKIGDTLKTYDGSRFENSLTFYDDLKLCGNDFFCFFFILKMRSIFGIRRKSIRLH